MEVKIKLGKALQDDYLSWLEVKKSLNVERSINNFLHYVHWYGTYAEPHIREEQHEE